MGERERKRKDQRSEGEGGSGSARGWERAREEEEEGNGERDGAFGTVPHFEPACASTLARMLIQHMQVTHLAFNPSAPILLVGDDRGGVLTLKVACARVYARARPRAH